MLFGKMWDVKYYPLPEWRIEFFWNNELNSDREQYNIISKIMRIWITVSNDPLNYLRNQMLFEKFLSIWVVVDVVSFDKNNLKNNDLLNSFWNKGVNYLIDYLYLKKWAVKYCPLPEWRLEFFWNDWLNSDREQYNIISKIMRRWISFTNDQVNYLRNQKLFKNINKFKNWSTILFPVL